MQPSAVWYENASEALQHIIKLKHLKGKLEFNNKTCRLGIKIQLRGYFISKGTMKDPATLLDCEKEWTVY